MSDTESEESPSSQDHEPAQDGEELKPEDLPEEPLPLPGDDDLQPGVPRFLPWRRGYGRGALTRDSIAGALVAILLIPQAFAYAQLADLPVSAGIAAAIVAPLVYALFGASCYLAVGPVALVSLLVGEAVGGPDGPAVALVLAALTGAFLFLLGLFRMGFLFRVFTRPVMAGFISAAAVVIATTQLEHILGVPLERGVPPATLWVQIAASLEQARWAPAVLGFTVLAGLLGLPRLFRHLLGLTGQPRGWRANLVRSLPLLILLAAAAVVTAFGLESRFGITTLGEIELPDLVPAPPPFLEVAWLSLVLPALSIALVAAVTTLAIAETLAARDGDEEVSKSRELFSLGLATAALSFTGGYPVGGSLSRSAVACDSGGRSPLASVVGATVLILATLFLSPVLSAIPRAALSALIFAAALSMLDFKAVGKTWREDRSGVVAMAVPFFTVLLLGVQPGLLAAFLAGTAHLGWQQWRIKTVAEDNGG